MIEQLAEALSARVLMSSTSSVQELLRKTGESARCQLATQFSGLNWGLHCAVTKQCSKSLRKYVCAMRACVFFFLPAHKQLFCRCK